MLARARADIHDIIRREHGILVMLHHNQGITQIPQTLQGRQQLIVVPLMQADAGLVQDIGHAHQAGADLSGQTDTLSLAAGQAAGGPGQGQIIQSHINQEADAGLNLFQDLFTNQLLLFCKLQFLQKIIQLQHGHRRHFRDILLPHGHRQRRLLQTLAAAGLTGRNPHEGLIFLTHDLGTGLPVAALHIFNQALEGHIIDALAPLPLIIDLHLTAIGSMNQYVPDLRGQLLIRYGQIEAVFFGKGF